MSKWKASIVREEDEETNREFAKEEKMCFKYFKSKLSQELKKEKDNILKAYGRHTMFHHLGHASFCGLRRVGRKIRLSDEPQRVCAMGRALPKKYMKYYRKNFDPKNEKDPKRKKKLAKLYDEKAAEEGRSIALAQIREAAVMRWRKQIYEFKDAWKSDDDKKMQECRDALYETFCTTGWMQTEVRKNERTEKGLKDTLVDKWTLQR